MKKQLAHFSMMAVLSLGLFMPGAAPLAEVPAEGPEMPRQTSEVEGLLNADGTLRLDEAYSGSLDLSGWDVKLDAERGPILRELSSANARPAAATPENEWADLGGGGGAAIEGTVHAMATIGTDVYVGGYFFNVDDISNADYLARWDGSNWHALGSGNYYLTGTVLALAVHGTDLYAGGYFSNAYNDGIWDNTAGKIAKWSGIEWSGLGSDGSGGPAITNGRVSAIAVDGSGNVYAGGTFTDVNNLGSTLTAADYVAKFNGTNWSALGSDGASGGSLNSEVTSLAISGSHVYVGGWFTNVNNGGSVLTAADYVAEWTGTNWLALSSDGSSNGSLNSWVEALVVDGSGNLYVGGWFYDVKNGSTTLGAADFVAKWDGSDWSALGSNGAGDGSLSGGLYAIAVDGSDVYVGGGFSGVNNNGTGIPEAYRVAMWDGSDWSALGSDGAGGPSIPTSTVYALASDGSSTYVGGGFRFVKQGGTYVSGAAYVVEWTGTGWQAMGGGQGSLRNWVNAIAISGTDVYVGGEFEIVTDKGTPIPAAGYIARWDGNNWHAMGQNSEGGPALDGTVWAISVNGPDVYVGGQFNDVYYGGTYHYEAAWVARWDGSWHALGSNGAGGSALNSTVVALATIGGDLYAGGHFTNVNNGGITLPTADYIAKWDGINWSALGSNGAGNGALNDSVRALATIGTDLYVGGEFTDAGNVATADYVAKWNGGSWSGLGNDGAGNGALNDRVYALATAGPYVYAGGWFYDVQDGSTTLGEADFLARWDGIEWSALGDDGSSDGSLGGDVYSIATCGRYVVAGGSFINVNDGGSVQSAADRLAVWNGSHWGSVGSATGGDGSLDAQVKAVAVGPEELFVGGQFTNVDDNGTVLPYADYVARYGLPALADTVGLYAGGWYFLRDANAPGPADKMFQFGWAGPTPIVGDWDGDGVDTPGIVNDGWFFLRNANSPGPADVVFQFGWAGATPLVGDWDGDGMDTIGIYGDGWFFLRNSNSPGSADLTFSYGWAGPTPLTGDWDGDGVDTIGIHSGSTFYLRNSNSSGPADMTFGFGWAGPTPIVGDWDGDCSDSIGIFSAGTYYLRNTNAPGAADLTFGYGWPGANVLSGTWDELRAPESAQ